jgi:hypothetical protein
LLSPTLFTFLQHYLGRVIGDWLYIMYDIYSYNIYVVIHKLDIEPCCPKTAADATLSQFGEQSVHIAEYSDATDLITANCCWISKGFVSDCLHCASSKLKIGTHYFGVVK